MQCPDCGHTMVLELADDGGYLYTCPFCGCTVDAPMDLDPLDQDPGNNEQNAITPPLTHRRNSRYI